MHARFAIHFHPVQVRAEVPALVTATIGGSILSVTTRPGARRFVQLAQYVYGRECAVEVGVDESVTQICRGAAPSPQDLALTPLSPVPASRAQGGQARLRVHDEDDPQGHLMQRPAPSFSARLSARRSHANFRWKLPHGFWGTRTAL